MGRLARIVRDGLLAAVLVLLAGLIVVRLDDAQRLELAGQATVIDGDTLILGGQRIRLAGIDAPELRQICLKGGDSWPCGREARDLLENLIDGAFAACAADGSDRYGRPLAVCTAAGRDLNAAMVERGYALAYGAYEAEENVARRSRLGLWAGTFDEPRAWRKTHGVMEELPQGSAGPGDGVLTTLRTWLARFWSWVRNG